jgi:multiubiquitin
MKGSWEMTDSGGPQEIAEFEERQARELRRFEDTERQDLLGFEKQEGAELAAFERRQSEHFRIKIDRTEYTVTARSLSGAQIRALPVPPIGPDRDLFEVVPGNADRKIGENTLVEMRNGLRFFTAPAQINPGALMDH